MKKTMLEAAALAGLATPYIVTGGMEAETIGLLPGLAVSLAGLALAWVCGISYRTTKQLFPFNDMNLISLPTLARAMS